MKPVLVIHGGAGSRMRTREMHARHILALEKILHDAYSVLARGGSALTAVQTATVALEDEPLYNAGKGSKIQSDGHIRMSASIMDGDARRFAGCVNVEGVKNPVLLARALLKHPDRVLSDQGARRMARRLGLEFASPFTDRQREAFRRRLSGKSGTVGAIALDRKGRLAAATSTGGRGFEFPHRVSDSPTCAGNFANEKCAVSATGHGEKIVESAAAATICAYVETGMPLKTAVKKVLARGGGFGCIALDAKGNIFATTNTPCLIWAAADSRGFRYF